MVDNGVCHTVTHSLVQYRSITLKSSTGPTASAAEETDKIFIFHNTHRFPEKHEYLMVLMGGVSSRIRRLKA